jgi:chemotaxis regulatin CheY-phosphate phosphatase CheZ
MAFATSMMIGMFASAAATTISDSFNNVEDTCTALNNANKQLDDLKHFWGDTISKEQLDIDNLTELSNNIQNIAATNGAATVALKETFRQKKMAQLLGLGVFTFVLVLGLLLKYFKVLPMLWNFITGK